MTQLNSVLLTGTIVGQPVRTEGSAAAFVIRNEYEGVSATFDVEVRDRGLVTLLMALGPGRPLRVVGRITRGVVSVHPGTEPRGHEEYTGRTYILAHHFEVLPNYSHEVEEG